jgi:uncharacterized membrane protein
MRLRMSENYNGKNRRANMLDSKGRKYTLAYCIFVVATLLMLIVPLIFLPFGWLKGTIFIQCLKYYTILVGTNVLAFVTGNSLTKKYGNGEGK